MGQYWVSAVQVRSLLNTVKNTQQLQLGAAGQLFSTCPYKLNRSSWGGDIAQMTQVYCIVLGNQFMFFAAWSGLFSLQFLLTQEAKESTQAHNQACTRSQ